ncbi:MAG TPA: RHS repeat-associated core domain-containing protein, partial [Acidimicrobiales bacterium]
KPDTTVVTYAWDNANNRTAAGAASYSYDERNRLTSGPDGSYAWSPRGTLQSVTNGTGTTSYTFDALGRLVDFNGVAAYTYDSLDRITSRGAAGFAYAGTEIDPVGDGTSSYARSPGGDLLAVSSAADGANIVGRNRHGDLTHLFDGDGTIDATREYDPFGAVLAATGVAGPAAGYQSDWTDPASGKVWMGARWYDAEDAAFASRDTVSGDLKTPISLNRYTYAFGDPLDFFDPDGHWGIRLWGGKKKSKGAAGLVKTAFKVGLTAPPKSASTLAESSQEARATRTQDKPRKFLHGSKPPHPVPDNWDTMSGRQKNAYNKKHNSSIKNIKLSNPWDAKEIMKDGGKGAINGVAAYGDVVVSEVTFGKGPKIGPVFKDEKSIAAYNAAHKVTEIGMMLAPGGGKVKAAAKGAKGLKRGDQARDLLKKAGDAKDRLVAKVRRKGGDCNSFTPSTRVVMADGTTRRITDVRVGYKVKAADPSSGRSGPRTVRAVIRGSGVKALVVLATALGTVTATAEHPFWVENRSEWVDAEDIRAGDRVRGIGGEDSAQLISSVRPYTAASADVVNLSVDDLHSFYVLVGDTPVLVHNADEKCSRALSEARAYAAEKPHIGKTRPAKVAAAVDRKTGKVYRGASGERVPIPKELQDRLPKESRTDWAVENCAEVNACARAMNDGASLDDLDVAAVNTKNGEFADPCLNCRSWLPGGGDG